MHSAEKKETEFRLGVFSTGDLLALATVVFFTGASWFQINAIGKMQDRTETRLQTLEQLIPSNYVQRPEYREDLRELKAALQRIETKLDGKADRP
jgi:hypothetical protein